VSGVNNLFHFIKTKSRMALFFCTSAAAENHFTGMMRPVAMLFQGGNLPLHSTLSFDSS